MRPDELVPLLTSLLGLGREAEWVEFKHNMALPQDIGEKISAVANAAGLHDKEAAYLVWGVEDLTHRVVGTNFRPRATKVSNEELENWLATQLEPRIHFSIHEFNYRGNAVVLFEVQACENRPVAFRGVEYIRVGSYTKKLKDHPEKERLLWIRSSQEPFEKGVAATGLSGDEILALIDYPAYFDLSSQRLPANKSALLDRLHREQMITPGKSTGRWNVTNLGAVLFAKKLGEFESIARKAVRVVIYQGNDRIHTVKEQVGGRGYAAGFEGLITYINDQLPRSEAIGPAFRSEQRTYPEPAVRELVANAIIHQDFTVSGDSPLIEIFSDRIEITNSGVPLINTLRFIDEPPQSRNEMLAAFMRRLSICEERGSGIDKVIFSVEYAQLPPPEFLVTENHTKVILYARRKLSEMDRRDKVRACYQHACLQQVSNQVMTNATLRKRLSIEDRNYSVASRIIQDTIREGLIRLQDPESTSRKHARYVPFWA